MLCSHRVVDNHRDSTILFYKPVVNVTCVCIRLVKSSSSPTLNAACSVCSCSLSKKMKTASCWSRVDDLLRLKKNIKNLRTFSLKQLKFCNKICFAYAWLKSSSVTTIDVVKNLLQFCRTKLFRRFCFYCQAVLLVDLILLNWQFSKPIVMLIIQKIAKNCKKCTITNYSCLIQS